MTHRVKKELVWARERESTERTVENIVVSGSFRFSCDDKGSWNKLHWATYKNVFCANILFACMFFHMFVFVFHCVKICMHSFIHFIHPFVFTYSNVHRPVFIHMSLVYLFTHLFIDSFIVSYVLTLLIWLFNWLFIHSVSQTLVHSFFHCVNIFIQSFNQFFMHCHICKFNYSFIVLKYSFNRFLTD